MMPKITFAHCDTMDGPVVSAAKKAIEYQNVNYVLIWVDPESELELKNIFNLTMNVRSLSEDAKLLADKYFFESLVRLHRTAEGIAYTGIRPEGTSIDKTIIAADRCIETGNLSLLQDMVPSGKKNKLLKLFDTVIYLKHYDVNDVSQGRRYVAAYVQFMHFAEDMTDHHHQIYPRHSWEYLPWILFSVFFLTAIFLGFYCIKRIYINRSYYVTGFWVLMFKRLPS